MVDLKDNDEKKNKEGVEKENKKNDEVVTSERVEEKVVRENCLYWLGLSPDSLCTFALCRPFLGPGQCWLPTPSIRLQPRNPHRTAFSLLL